jgi:hypothetical protein
MKKVHRPKLDENGGYCSIGIYFGVKNHVIAGASNIFLAKGHNHYCGLVHGLQV